MEIFKLFGSIMVDNDKANKSISDTDKKAEGLGKKFLKGVGTVGKWGAAIVGAAVAGGAALFGMATKAAGVTDNIDKMSQKLGMSRQGFQEWEFICSQSGTSIEKLSSGMKGLATKMEDANKGGKSSSAMFKKLGINIKDTSGKLKSQEQVFEESVKKLQEMEDGTEKAALASKLFGKAGQELMPLLNGAAGSVDEMKKKAHELGLVISDEAIDAGVKFTDTLDQLKRSFEAVVTNIGVAVMPMMQAFCDWIMQFMPEIQAVLSAFFKGVEFFVSLVVTAVTSFFGEMNLSWDSLMQGLQLAWEVIGKPVLDAITPLLQSLYDNWGIIWDAIKTHFETVWMIIKGAWDNIGKPTFDFIIMIVGEVANFFAERMPAIANFFSEMVNDIRTLWKNNLEPCLKAIGDFINNVLAPAFKFVFNNVIGPVVDSCFKLIKNLWTKTLQPVLKGICSFLEGVFTGSWNKVWNGLGNIVKGVFNGLVSVVKTPINAIIGMVNRMIGGLNRVKIPDWVPLIGGKGINIPNIPMLAKGTSYFNGGMAIVGEEGPELVKMPRGSQVIPHRETEEKLKGGVTLNINKFINNSDEDIEVLCDKIAFYLERRGIF
ncbi:phage tail tape measure protein [uncultured Clostridium sp.]|uniref:phage tail tape measure protein n=1 Tax=uncultured Clostridium sp. TaxID=59620 RepID=UPI002628935F|nr:phage tail tape measure protein [uncultured Clostridium sp.]